MTIQKYTIPGGHDFRKSGMSDQVAFFAWLAHNQVDPGRINPSGDVTVTSNDGLWALTATTAEGSTGTWPLGTPTTPVIAWLADNFGPKSVPLDGVKDRLAKLADARSREKAAKEEAEELRAEVLGILAAQRAKIGTVDGKPFIQAKTVEMPGKFNRKAFEAAYPEIADQYTGAAYEQIRLEFL